MSAAGLLTTTDDDLLRRFTESANTQDRAPVPTPSFRSWFAELRKLVNMDARTVLPGIPFAAPVDRPSMFDEDSFRGLHKLW
ncbi:hypothetical protein AB0M80_02715 [Amycolatopsis sp. NPDC051045]|uniref:hypothetical protein n=1 Tax=Amycolatopsis sp. NPDC051045 TaxID=3156922 RepID=UPI003449A347